MQRMPEFIAINQNRIEYMLSLFCLSMDELLAKINEGGENPIQKSQINTGSIRLSHLKKIDEIFKQGLSFYTDPTNLSQRKQASIFFRKKNFNAEISLGDRQIVNQTEKDIHHLSAINKLSGKRINRIIETYTTNDKAEDVAYQMRSKLYPQEIIKEDKGFLKLLIETLSNYNILVLEFVETWNKKNKTDLDGFFISPNVLVIKRQQIFFKREIFTLAHELGHYLLDEEEIDNNNFANKNPSVIEKWCDTFAFAFLGGAEIKKQLEKINPNNASHDNATISKLSYSHHLSRLALFTNLTPANMNIISWEQYKKIKEGLEEQFKKEQKAEKQKKEAEKLRLKELGIKPQGGGTAKAIHSPLEKDIYRHAYFEGVLSEYDLLSRFKSKDIDKLLYE